MKLKTYVSIFLNVCSCKSNQGRDVSKFQIRFASPAIWAAMLFVFGAFQSSALVQSSAIDLMIDPGTNNDAAVLELQSAIRDARASGVPSTINVFSNGVYTFTQPENWEYGPNALPQISGNIAINGNGATLQRGTNAPKFRFLYVSGGLSYETNTGVGLPAGALTLNNLTLTGGLAKGGNGGDGGGGAGMGGAIFNQGSLTLNTVTFAQNTAQGGDGGGGPGDGGGGIGGDADAYGNGGGFGGPFLGRGGSGGAGTTNAGGGGGGGFMPYDNSLDQITSLNSGPDAFTNGFYGAGGGLGGLGGGSSLGGSSQDGGNGGFNGGFDLVVLGGEAGGAFGFGGSGIVWVSVSIAGGGGGVGGGGGGGGYGNLGAGSGGFGGGGGSQYVGQPGGFGGGGGGSGGDPGGEGGFAGGYGSYGGGGGGGLGGAIFNHRGSIAMTNCTLTGNNALGGNPDVFQTDYFEGLIAGSGYGGGIFNLNGTVTLIACSLSSNYCNAGYAELNGGENPYVYVSTAAGNAEGGAFYNLAYGNKIEDGSASVATVTFMNTILTNSVGTNYVGGVYFVPFNGPFVPIHDLVNNEIDGLQTNMATVVFSADTAALSHVDLGAATSISALTGSQAALLSAAGFTADPEFQFKVVGVPGYNYVVQASTNLSDWSPVQTNTAPFLFVDPVPSSCPARFYRASYQP